MHGWCAALGFPGQAALSKSCALGAGRDKHLGLGMCVAMRRFLVNISDVIVSLLLFDPSEE